MCPERQTQPTLETIYFFCWFNQYTNSQTTWNYKVGYFFCIHVSRKTNPTYTEYAHEMDVPNNSKIPQFIRQCTHRDYEVVDWVPLVQEDTRLRAVRLCWKRCVRYINNHVLRKPGSDYFGHERCILAYLFDTSRISYIFVTVYIRVSDPRHTRVSVARGSIPIVVLFGQI